MHGKARSMPPGVREGGRVGEYAPKGTEGLQGGSRRIGCAVANKMRNGEHPAVCVVSH